MQLERAHRSAPRLTDILDHFKELDSFLQSSRALFPVDLRKTILQVMTTHQMAYDIQGDAEVLADFELSSVIDNLVRNAKRHGDAININFVIRREGGTVQLVVADDGNGIPYVAKPRLFQEGFSYGERRGTGLGLFWIRKTMERVIIKTTAAIVVILLRTVAAPLLPKIVWLEPPNAAPSSAPLPP